MGETGERGEIGDIVRSSCLAKHMACTWKYWINLNRKGKGQVWKVDPDGQ